MKKLNELTPIEHAILKSSDMLKRIYPEATGEYEEDCKKSNGEDFNKVEEEDLWK